MITEDYVSIEVAELLKKKGFDEESWCAYHLITEKFAREIVDFDFRYNHGLPNYVASAPTLQMAMKWLREVHKIDMWVECHNSNRRYKGYIHSEQRGDEALFYEDSYEEACEVAIKYCLENLV